jgi:6-hydroxycyclohex-1-ene-1-carbonyl-CoA dehydrogenase
MSTPLCHAWQMHKQPSGETELRETSFPQPERGEKEAVVRIAGCGVCGTDLGYFFDGIPTVTSPPLTLGHEASGVVVSGPSEWLGARVLVPTIIPCRRCELCSSGRANACLSQRMLGRSYGPHGAFASHIAVPVNELCRVPDDASIDLAALSVVTDAVATPYQACRRARVQPGDKVIVVGATGGLGIHAVQWARTFGASAVVGIARRADRLRLLEGAGLDVGVTSDGDAAGVRRKIWDFCKSRRLNPRHSWKILEVSGTEPGLRLALELLSYASTLVLVGYTPAVVPFQLSRLMAFDAEVIGSWGCDPRLYPEVLAKVLSGDIQILPYTELRPMSEIRKVFDELRGGRGSMRRIVLTPDWQAGA